MSLSASVYLCYGIDYGTKKSGDRKAWAWEKTWGSTAMDDNGGGGCEGSTFNGGEEGRERLVVFAQLSLRNLIPDRDIVPPVVDVMQVVGGSSGAMDSLLRAFCEERGLTPKPGKWMIVANVG